MYIAGLNLAIGRSQQVEGIVALATFVELAAILRSGIHELRAAEEEGKSIKRPVSFIAKSVSPIYAVAGLGPPVVYLLAVLGNKLEHPEWFARYSFPAAWGDMLGEGGKAAVRLAACVGTAGCYALSRVTVKRLGSSFSFIGVREKARVVSTGPYAYIRHPLYALVLAQSLLFSPMLWSYIPVITFPIVVMGIAAKIPLEEKLIEEDDTLGSSYVAYKENVPFRLIPYIW